MHEIKFGKIVTISLIFLLLFHVKMDLLFKCINAFLKRTFFYWMNFLSTDRGLFHFITKTKT